MFIHPLSCAQVLALFLCPVSFPIIDILVRVCSGSGFASVAFSALGFLSILAFTSRAVPAEVPMVHKVIFIGLWHLLHSVAPALSR